jgi:hypothetical protein
VALARKMRAKRLKLVGYGLGMNLLGEERVMTPNSILVTNPACPIGDRIFRSWYSRHFASAFYALIPLDTQKGRELQLV